MNIEKSNLKLLNILTLIALVAVLFTLFGGTLTPQPAIPGRNAGLSVDGSSGLIRSESAQNGLTVKILLIITAVLLMTSFGAILLILISPQTIG